MVSVDSHGALLVAGATTRLTGPSLCQIETYSPASVWNPSIHRMSPSSPYVSGSSRALVAWYPAGKVLGIEIGQGCAMTALATADS